MATMKDFYGVLEVAKDADVATIKKSYRKLVLKYHPDKNPEDRDAAEERIRELNAAYEVLSNPAKKAAFDGQALAMASKARGVRLDVTVIRPRSSVPKTFMLSPMGHPDMFMRGVGSNAMDRGLCFHTREDVKDTNFDDFFAAARFSLWWVPHEKVNNMCRLRTAPMIMTGVVGYQAQPAEVDRALKHSMKSRGPPSGLILTFGLTAHSSCSDIMLSNSEDEVCSNVIAMPSPDYPGAFRFMSAFFHNHFLAFDPPNRTQMMLPMDHFQIVDFMCVDYAAAEKFKNLNEVLIPAVINIGGNKDYVSLTKVCQDPGVRHFFYTTMGNTFWDFEDFEMYFHGHSDLWDYIPKEKNLRMRGAEEKLGVALKRMRNSKELIAALTRNTGGSTLMDQHGKDIEWLPLDAIDHVLRLLEEKPLRVKIFQMLKQMCNGGKPIPLQGMISIYASLGKPYAGLVLPEDAELKQLRVESREAVSARMLKLIDERNRPTSMKEDSVDDLLTFLQKFERLADGAGGVQIKALARSAVSARGTKLVMSMKEEKAADPLDMESLNAFLVMPLDWEKCGPILAQKAQSLLGAKPLEELAPLLWKAAKAKAGSFGESMAMSAMMKTFGAAPGVAIDALEAMVSGGFGLEGAAMTLRMQLQRAPPEAVVAGARVVAGLLERGVQDGEVEGCLHAISSKPLPGSAFASLIKGASTCKSSSTLQSICKAAAKQMDDENWTLDDLIKLLSALCGTVGQDEASAESAALLARIATILKPRLAAVSCEQFSQVTVAVARVPACQSLYEAAAAESRKRLGDMSPQQLLRVTEGLVPLGRSNATVSELLQRWYHSIRDEEASVLEPDEFALLAKLIGPVATSDNEVVEELAMILLSQMAALTPRGLSLVDTFLDSNDLSFPSKQKLSRGLRDAQKESRIGDQASGGAQGRGRSRSPRRNSRR